MMSDPVSVSQGVVFSSPGGGGAGRSGGAGGSRFRGRGLLAVLGLLVGGLGVVSAVAGQTVTPAVVSPVAAESVRVTVDDATVAATMMTDNGGKSYYEMKFGDWSRVTVQLQHADENDDDKMKNAAFGRDGSGGVVFDVWQRELPDAVTAIGGFGAASTGLDAKCGAGGTRDCAGGWSTTFYDEVKTDENGRLSFYVYAPADTDPNTAGTVRTLVVRAWEKVNGPASVTNPNLNKRLHYFYVRVSEGARTTSGVVPTTTVPAGKRAAGFTVTFH